uniref:Rho GTPase activating protein 45 n=1 Tax=Mandrillus leucophaeus TaxID=9568 RepID=A0A2K5ZN88_MANLE
MFSRKKRDLMKTPSISKKNRAGSPSPQPSGPHLISGETEAVSRPENPFNELPLDLSKELPRKDGVDAVFPGPSLEPSAGSSSTKATGTLKRPTSLSRHASAAGFPLSGAASWTLGRSHRSPLTAASPGEQPTEGAGPDGVEDISHLLADVARFAEGLEKLKECVLHDDLLEARRPLAHECLGEALRVMRQIISKYPLLNTVETLTAAGTLIAKVKAFHYESNNDLEKQEFEKALETIAVAFSSTVSEFLMGEVDSSTLLAVPPGDSSQSMESLYGPGSEGTPPGLDDCDAGCLPAEEVDVLLQRCEGGVDAALLYAKNMAKYMKDLISYLEKRTTLEMEFAKGLQKISHNCRQSVMQEPHMPLLSIYSLALEQDLEFGHGMVQAVGTLQTQTFMQPLTLRRLEHEKRRKEIKEAWHSPVLRARKSSFNVSDVAGPEAAGSPPEEGIEGAPAKERRAGRGHQVHKSWPLSISDSDSGLDTGPGTGDFKKFERTSSSGTMSSTEELVDPEGGAGASAFEQADLNGMTPELPVAVPSGPFRHEGLSKAARTHRLRKLRTPAKCRECNSYVYFQGAECEECCLACHKKCLETLAIQCGHKKLQGRLQLFGQDFSQAARSAPDGVPFIVKKCVCEIERRALRTKGIYRVNGVKTRVEKLCQAFENGKELVELSQASPHDISNVLKLYLRQLPEPLISFRLYHELVGLAKDSLKAEAEAKAASRGRQDGSESEAVAVAMAGRLRELLRDLPLENRASLQYLLRHLRRIVEVEQDNKMTPGNLGIVFGPTLLRPRPTEATVSLSSLVDYPHQARVIETLIVHYGLVFEEEPEETPGGQDESSSQRAEVVIQVPYLEAGEGVVYPLQETAEDGCRESRVVSNDSDSDLEEASELLLSSEASALRRLSLLEQQQSEASLEEASGSHSGSEEQLEATAREDGDEDDPARQLSGFNTNQSNNVLQAPLPTMRLRGGRIALGSCRERRPEFV